MAVPKSATSPVDKIEIPNKLMEEINVRVTSVDTVRGRYDDVLKGQRIPSAL